MVSEADDKLTTYIMVRLTPEMKKELEDKVWEKRTTIPDFVRARIKRYITTPSKTN